MHKLTADQMVEYVAALLRQSGVKALTGGTKAVVEVNDYVAASKVKYVISQTEVDDLYKLIEDQYTINGLQLHNRRYLEIPVPLYLGFAEEIPHSVNTATNVSYSIGHPSKEYMLFLMSITFGMPIVVSRYVLHWGHVFLDEVDNPQSLDLLTFFSLTSKISTIKLVSNRDIKHNLMLRYANSYSYEISYTTGRRCELYLTQDRMFDVEKIQLHREGEPETISAPKRMYNKDLTDSYQHYLENSLASSKYLSLYHILEHFFNRASIRETIERVRGVITKTGFSPKKEEHIRDLITEAVSNIEVGQDSKLANKKEQKALALVISQYVSTPNQIKVLLTEEEVEYYSSESVAFCDGPILDFSKSPEDFFADCAQRIYMTRNSIVHSKSENTKKYNFAKDKNALMREIPLIRTLAEIVIEEESELIE